MTDEQASSEQVAVGSHQASAAGGELWRLNLGREAASWHGLRGAPWWTGIAPTDQRCPGLVGGHLRALPPPHLGTCTRNEVQAYFDNGWTLTELLFAALQGEEAFYRPPVHDLRHPLIFYYAHPAVLYVNKLRLAGLLDGPIDAYFEAVFETGVDEMRWDDLSKNTMRWPEISQVQAYRATVYRAVKRVIAQHEGLATGHSLIGMDHPLWALFMGFEHERIHLETSSVLIRELPVHLVQRPIAFPPLHPSAVRPSAAVPSAADIALSPLVQVGGAQVRYGKSSDVPYYGWDNEYGQRAVSLRPFEAARRLTSNGEYWAFVKAGGYADAALWSSEGWAWRQFRNTKWPAFWVQNGPASSHLYELRTLFEVIPMQWDWPAIVNYHEASAYARWRSRTRGAAGEAETGDAQEFRLISEAEHHRLRAVTTHREPVNAEFAFSSESPVTSGGDGFNDLFGNVWQWCDDHFHPLTGFRVHPHYEDFSTPCFDGEHHMIVGGSFASTGHEAQAWARFHFRPHFTQHAGMRLVLAATGNDGAAVKLAQGPFAPGVRPSTGSGSGSAAYESDQLVNDYLLMHYGAASDQMPYAFGPQGTGRFPERCAELGLTWADRLKLPLQTALDVGCAVGAATFRLGEAVSDYALGIDLSEAFVTAATTLKDTGSRRYFQREEGELGVWRDATVSSATARARSRFQRGDASALPPDLVDFDLVLLANLICRIPSPRSCLQRMGGARGVVRKGGLLVITCPFTWMAEYTPIEAWLGGKMEAGAERRSEPGLVAALGPEFELLERRDMPFAIREHKRKFQYVVPLALVFRRLP